MKHGINVFVALWLLAATAAGEMRAETYPLVFNNMEALEAVAKTIVADEGHVVQDASGRRLIVLTTPQKHAALNQALDEAATPTGNVRIEVRFRDQGADRHTGAGMQTDVEIEMGPRGLGSRVVVRPDLRYTAVESCTDTRMTVLAASGREAALRVGESVPHLQWIMEYGRRGGYIESRVHWQRVGSFLVVTPTILHDGETVHVRVTPELRGRVHARPHHVRFAGLETEVFVSNGQTLSIGELAQDQSFYSRFLVGVDQAGIRRALNIELTPHIMHPQHPEQQTGNTTEGDYL